MARGIRGKGVVIGSVTSFMILLTGAPPVAADDGLAAAKHRQAVMDHLGDDLKAIKLYLRGAAEQPAAAAAARDLETTARLVPGLFPKGSDSKSLPGKSAAKPEIWDNPDDFQQLEQALANGAGTLRKAVDGGDSAEITDAMRSLAKNACGACHQDYRGKKDGE